MTPIEKLIHYAHKEQKPLYIEFNDFMNGGLSIRREIADLLDSEDIDENFAEQMLETNSVWSIRIYHQKDTFDIIYHYDLVAGVQDMCDHLGI